jgi:hypothetical protein
MAATTFNLDAADIAAATGCPPANVKRFWPAIQAACLQNGLTDRASVIAIVATIATEVRSFEPVNEYGGDEYYKKYEGRADLGNTQPGDGVRFHGRGFIQLTGRANYRSYGQKLGIPLEAEPERALEPDVAARLLTSYFADRKIADFARSGDWKMVRRKVNGGLTHIDLFSAIVGKLEKATAAKEGVLVEGSLGPDVVALKKLLRAWGQEHPLPKPLKLTPLFGPATTAAVKAFQKASGIQATGKVGRKTWLALEAAAKPDVMH